MHRPDRQVVDVGVGGGRGALVGRVRGEPDDPLRPDDGARLGGRRVVLADVHAVGADRDREVRPVVEHEQRPRVRGGAPERLGRAADAVVVERRIA